MIDKNDKIFIAGHKGMVGSAIIRKLIEKNFCNIITISKKKLDLRDQKKVFNFLKKKKPKIVFICAAKVGGIMANFSNPAEYLYDNTIINLNLIHGCYINDIKKIIYLGSSCIYPRNTKQPIKENQLLSGYLEKTNEAYALAKINGLKLCETYNKQYKKFFLDYRAVMPTNLYGPGDTYDLKKSHVIPSLIKRIHDAKINNKKKIKVWGNGKAKRDFLHVDDLADACIKVMLLSKRQFYKNKNDNFHINIGSNKEISIKELVNLIKLIIGYNGIIKYDRTKPNGTLRKKLEISQIKKIGWKPKIRLADGLIKTYQNYLKNL
jgi:GDP-L-fucose synthase